MLLNAPAHRVVILRLSLQAPLYRASDGLRAREALFISHAIDGFDYSPLDSVFRIDRAIAMPIRS